MKIIFSCQQHAIPSNGKEHIVHDKVGDDVDVGSAGGIDDGSNNNRCEGFKGPRDINRHLHGMPWSRSCVGVDDFHTGYFDDNVDLAISVVVVSERRMGMRASSPPTVPTPGPTLPP